MRLLRCSTLPVSVAVVAAALACVGAAGQALAQSVSLEDVLDLLGEGSVAGAESGPQTEGLPFSLHVPDMMVAGAEYRGVVVFEDAAEARIAITLAASDDGVILPGTVAVERGRNHAVFEILPADAVGAGPDRDVTVHAVALGRVAEAETTVYTQSGSNVGLKIVAPTNGQVLRTEARNLPIFAYLTNDQGTPVPADARIEARLSSSSHAIGFPGPETVLTIPEGGYVAAGRISVSGSGTVYATADGIPGDSLEVEFVGSEYEVRMAVAPEAVGRHSQAHYFVWLAKDGKHFVPQYAVPVTLSSSDPSAASFAGPLVDRPVQDYIYDGVASGSVYVGESAPSLALLTASVRGIGAQTVEIAVSDVRADTGEFTRKTLQDVLRACSALGTEFADGLLSDDRTIWRGVAADLEADVLGGLDDDSFELGAEILDAVLAELEDDLQEEVAAENERRREGLAALIESECSRYQRIDGAALAGGDANVAIIEVHPRDSSTLAWGVVSGYRAFDGVAGTEGDGALSGLGVMFPASFGFGTALNLAGSPGIGHPDVIDAGGKRVAVFPISILEPGEHAVSVSGSGIEGATVSFGAGERYGSGYSLEVTPLPLRVGDEGDLALAYAVDGDGTVVDLDWIAGEERHVHVSRSSGGVADLDGPHWITNSAMTFKGIHERQASEIFVHMPGLHSRETAVAPSGVPLGIKAWLPDAVHSSEEFPFAVHYMGSDGIPVGIASDVTLSPAARSGDLYVLDGGGTRTISAISEGGLIDTVEVEVFKNGPLGVVIVPITGERINVGDEIALELFIEGAVDPIVELVGSLDFERIGDGRYASRAAASGEHEVEVRVSAEGWEEYAETLSFTVEHLVSVSHLAVSDDGVSIPARVALDGIANVGGEARAVSGEIPSGANVLTQPGIYDVTVQTGIEIGERAYSLERVKVNGEEVRFAETFSLPVGTTTDIETIYHRVIEVDIAVLSEEPLPPVEIDGAGRYRYGDIVTLTAPIVYEWFYMARHLPAGWNGLPPGAEIGENGLSASFEAISSVYGSVEYRKDYAVLILALACATAGGPLAIWRLAPGTFAGIGKAPGAAARRLRKRRDGPRPETEAEVKVSEAGADEGR